MLYAAWFGEPVLFVSSRRRHTIFDWDWSSDVCSSDLKGLGVALEASPRFLAAVGSLERHAQAVVRLIVVGRQPQRLCETRQRRCRLGEVHERGAAAAMRRGQIGLQCQRALVTPERLGVEIGRAYV